MFEDERNATLNCRAKLDVSCKRKCTLDQNYIFSRIFFVVLPVFVVSHGLKTVYQT